MRLQKRWSFGLGTIFSLIVVYFIFLYSKEKGWTLLAFLSKWYLIIVICLMLLSFGIILLILLTVFTIFLISIIKIRKVNKKHKKEKDYIDAEYKIKG